jgi:tetratricopeptide (TPR) repeat protein
MGLFYDDLVFDDRVQENLFSGYRHKYPSYADILKRWEFGCNLTAGEKKKVCNILIFYPDYILNSGRTEEIIELIRNSLQLTDIYGRLNPEKGLLLYTLLLLLLIHRKIEESFEVVERIKNFIIDFCQTSGTSYSVYSVLPAYLEKAYVEIIIRIMDRRELLWVKPGFSISQLPLFPAKKLPVYEGNDLRGRALDYYQKKEYDKASDLYRKMLINKFEMPGTLTHLIRLEMTRCNLAQAEIFVINAWRIRHEAPAYVLARILFFVVLLKVLRADPIENWLGCIKEVLNRVDSRMEWDMERLISIYEKDINPQKSFLLRALLRGINNLGDEGPLNEIEAWQKSVPIDFEKWPDFDIVFYF